MFNSISKNLSFSSILSGISKTLNVVNQIIPIYNQAKPTISNAKKIFSSLKGISKNTINNDNNINIENKKIDNNLPIFFS